MTVGARDPSGACLRTPALGHGLRPAPPARAAPSASGDRAQITQREARCDSARDDASLLTTHVCSQRLLRPHSASNVRPRRQPPAPPATPQPPVPAPPRVPALAPAQTRAQMRPRPLGLAASPARSYVTISSPRRRTRPAAPARLATCHRARMLRRTHSRTAAPSQPPPPPCRPRPDRAIVHRTQRAGRSRSPRTAGLSSPNCTHPAPPGRARPRVRAPPGCPLPHSAHPLTRVSEPSPGAPRCVRTRGANSAARTPAPAPARGRTPGKLWPAAQDSRSNPTSCPHFHHPRVFT